MPPSDPIKGTRGSQDLPPPNPADEIQDQLNEAALVGDPQWSESEFRSQHLKLNLALEALRRFMRGDEKMTEEKLKKSLDAWTQSPDFSAPENKEFNDKTIKSIHAQLRKLRSSELTTRATKVKEFLPPPPPEPQPVVPPQSPTATPPPTPAPVPAKGVDTFEMDKYWNVGVSLRQDTGLLWLFDQAGIPISILASDRQDFNIRGSLDFPIEDHVGMARVHFGTSEMRGVPGATASRFGIDIGSVDPTSKGHFSTGVGLESIGPPSDVPNAPGHLFRLHFFRQSDLTWAPTENIQLGFGFFLNQQETYLPVGDEPLLAGSANTSVSFASNLYARNSIPWVVVSGRYYLNGVPKFSEPDISKPFQGGEGTTKVASLLPSKIIMFNRARDNAAFALDQVFMALEPLGPKASKDQFDALSWGLLAFNILDGQIIAANADTTAEILLRGNGIHQGEALGLHGAGLLWHVVGALTREPDPDPAAMLNNPGSVVDFTGRAHNTLWKLDLWEALLTGGTYFLEKETGKKGKTPTKTNQYHEKLTPAEEKENEEINRDKTTYKVVGGVAAGVGVAGVLTAGGITGRGCGKEGVFLTCTYHGTRESMFAPGQNFTPETMTTIENHSVVSTMFASLIPWGVSKLFYSAPEPKSAEESSTRPGPNIAFVAPRLELTPDKFYLGVTVQNW